MINQCCFGYISTNEPIASPTDGGLYVSIYLVPGSNSRILKIGDSNIEFVEAHNATPVKGF